MVKVSALKSGLPTIAAINGVKMFATSEVTSAPNAAPITTATARSTTLPRKMNSRNSFSMLVRFATSAPTPSVPGAQVHGGEQVLARAEAAHVLGDPLGQVARHRGRRVRD